ncbi:putative metal-dependent hydrolase YcfH [Candidatus Kinetoplastibacterium sorsogonicusi]|uniref:Putative metal-dependent hydrolase YcfH n=1 Tax=Candidatus Kinetoplastidibacterium kentomonadis TaxID=1576550 RepID=A0A3S7J9V6_9PROT|nr:TatD family hydrolase [Candidatus Kinetoplastibacterium sorsogonicusi]AWD32444.1 putative metal-dependent hydrolase YcfH [Candidatus Kinetoplastibacterium sorsogonicusi]
MYIDSHCHINFPELLKNIDSIIKNMEIKKVSNALVVGIDNKSSNLIINLVKKYKNLWASIGTHPNSHINDDLTYNELCDLSINEKVIAIGETGLDFYNCNSKEIYKIQKNRFCNHIRASINSNLPLIIHTRNAANDTIDILNQEKAFNGVIHCFTETMDFAKKVLDMNFFISLSGIITFKNAQNLRDIIKYIPLDKLLIETDSPFLSPEPYRGKINEPSNVTIVAKKVAEIKNIPIDVVAKNTTNNFFSLFKKISYNQ